MISLDNISFSYGDKDIITSFSAQFEENKTYCVMGESGVGKTTLLNLLSGLLKPKSGEILGIHGKRKAFIFQENRLIPWLSIRDNLKYVTDDEAAVSEALKRTGLSGCADMLPDALSGGMARRAAIARAVAFSGDIFFIDEPLYGLDIKTSENILSLIKDAVKGKTSFIVTHSPKEAYYLADDIIFLKSAPVDFAEIIPKHKFKNDEEIAQMIKM